MLLGEKKTKALSTEKGTKERDSTDDESLWEALTLVVIVLERLLS